MKRYRSMKRDFWRDPKPAKVSIPARLLFWGLVSHSDDHGRLSGEPAAIKGDVFSRDETTYAEIVAWLLELHHVGLARLYGTAQEPYIHIVNFQAHQQQRTIQPSGFPTPGTRGWAYFTQDVIDVFSSLYDAPANPSIGPALLKLAAVAPCDLQANDASPSSDPSLDERNDARKVREGKVREGSRSEPTADEPTVPAEIQPAYELACKMVTMDGERSMWAEYLTLHRSTHPGIPAEQYVDAMLRTKAWADSQLNGRYAITKAWGSFLKDLQIVRRDGVGPAPRNAAAPAFKWGAL